METENRMVVRYLQTHPAYAARSLEHYQPQEISAVLESVPADAAEGLLAALPPKLAADCLTALPAKASSTLTGKLSADLAAGLLRRLDGNERTALLADLPLHVRDRLRRLLRYGEHTVGALMELEYLQVFGDCTVRHARQGARESLRSCAVYVVTREQRLIGTTSLRVLEDSPAEATMAELACRPLTTLSPRTDYAIAVGHPCWLEVDEVPIVTRDGVFMGVLHHRAVRSRASGARSSGGSGLDTAIGFGEAVWLGLQGLVDTVMVATAGEARRDS